MYFQTGGLDACWSGKIRQILNLKFCLKPVKLYTRTGCTRYSSVGDIATRRLQTYLRLLILLLGEHLAGKCEQTSFITVIIGSNYLIYRVLDPTGFHRREFHQQLLWSAVNSESRFIWHRITIISIAIAVNTDSRYCRSFTSFSCDIEMYQMYN